MAKYTVELRSLVESNTPIFDFEYPMFDPAHKQELEKKIINHYYFREICCETIGRWKHYLRSKMNEIMPKYNLIYEAYAGHTISVFSNEKTNANEQYSVNNVVTNTGGNTSTTTNDMTESTTGRDVTHTDGTDTSKKRTSDTPQGRLALNDGDISGDYATTLERDDNTINHTDTILKDTDITNKGTQKIETDNDTTMQTTGINIKTGGNTGYSGVTEAELLDIYIKKWNDIDVLIIADLADLFMKVY